MKFSQVTPNTSLSLADYLMGVTSGNVDFRATIQTLINLLNTSNKFTNGAIDWSTAGKIWWEELGRTTLSGAASSISLTGLSAKKYIRIIVVLLPSGNITGTLRFNNDSGNNYAYRYSDNGAADSTLVNNSSIYVDASGNNAKLAVLDIVNISATEKIVTGLDAEQGTAGAGNAPVRRIAAGKWANTSSQITRVDIATGANNFAAGSELIVLGHN